jgi:hypothetical protein
MFSGPQRFLPKRLGVTDLTFCVKFQVGVSCMLDAQPKEFNPGQVAVLDSLLRAGFTFVTFERYARYLGVERDGFVALLETAGGKVQLFGQVGYHVGEGIAMLVERGFFTVNIGNLNTRAGSGFFVGRQPGGFVCRLPLSVFVYPSTSLPGSM